MAGSVQEEAVKLRNNITNLYEKAIEHVTVPFHRSGAIVSCEPLEGYPLHVTTEPGATSITRCGKNLGNFKTDISKLTFTSKSGSLVNYYGYETALPPGTYTVHAEYASGTYLPTAGEDYMYGLVVDGDNKVCLNAAGETISVSTVMGSTLKTPTFDLPEGCKILIYHAFSASNITQSQARTLFDRWNVQIELGSKSTPYEPYTCDTFAPGEIIHAISGVNTLWADAGDITVEGRANNIEDAYDTGFAQGEQAEYDHFWDAYQDNGNRKEYAYAFAGQAWTDETYNPKYPINATVNSNALFANNAQITDTKVPINLGTSSSNKLNMFQYASNLVTIRELIWDSNLNFASQFTGCTKLKNITLNGTITRDINMQWCPLTPESAWNVVQHLKYFDMDSTDFMKYTITFSAAVWEALDEYTRENELHGWGYVKDYIENDIGWQTS